MIKLHAKLKHRWDDEPFVARVTLSSSEAKASGSHILLLSPGVDIPRDLSRFLVPAQSAPAIKTQRQFGITLPESLGYLTEGDIVCVNPRAGELTVMYRRSSAFNTIFITARCNSDCIMCSQPPQPQDDSFLVGRWLEAIPLMHPETRELGFTGGEPTLLEDHFLELIRVCTASLPNTSLHVLSNGRLFNYMNLCRAVADIGHADLMFGIPLYSDIAWRHDFVVQAAGAFDQTIRGIMNLKRCGVRVEIRVVLHRQTIDRLPQLARFIARNLPMVDHVALMGLEMMGYVRMNLDALWIDPANYQPQLAESVQTLDRARIQVSIYNHQLCVLDRKLWPYARQSISDWKNEYLDVCDGCSVRSQCGGFFTSTLAKHSEHISPIMIDSSSPRVAAMCHVT